MKGNSSKRLTTMSSETITQFCIVIPCYNEAKRIAVLHSDYISFIKANPKAILCFVNDGSTDETIQTLEYISDQYPNRVCILDEKVNGGKAESVRKGIQYANSKFSHSYIGFLDADLSTPLTEFSRLLKELTDDQKLKFVFASRIELLGSRIIRTKFRFFASRIVATVISKTLNLRVYDTQCGCKLFSKEVSLMLFDKPFTSRWLFDVEIFFRLINFYGREDAIKSMREVPLRFWDDPGVSKIKWTYFLKFWQDIFRIRRRYKKRTLLEDKAKRKYEIK
jgi:glycosyltransferase involved in cell wall biosynthesis